MVLPSASNMISLSKVATEFGGTEPHSMTEYYGAASGVPSSGTLSLSNFWGKAFSGPPVSGYTLWLDASDATSLTVTNTLVSEWRDKSGNAYHFAQSNSTYMPVYNANALGTNKPGLILWSASMTQKGLFRLANAVGTLASSSALSMFFVVKPDSTDWNLVMSNWFNAQNKDDIYRIHYSLSTNYSLRKNTLYANGVQVLNSGTTSTTQNHVCGFCFAGQNVVSYGWVNGTSTAFTPSVALPSSAASSTSAFWIGDIRGNAQTGAIAEVVAYPSALTLTQQQSIVSYLNTKWGVY